MSYIPIMSDDKPIKLKLFGTEASRVSTEEMYIVFNEIISAFDLSSVSFFNEIKLTKPLPSKKDHGDIDIVLSRIEGCDTESYILQFLGKSVVKYELNGPLIHVLYFSNILNKKIQVDFNMVTACEFNSTVMYMAYNDFSGILGVISRKLYFRYGATGFYKIFVDKNGVYNYILLTQDLYVGLQMLGYEENVIERFDNINTLDDIVSFISNSKLFDVSFLTSSLNRGDRKRLREERPTARYCRDKLIALNKAREIDDYDYYFILLFPDLYSKYLNECDKINSKVFVKLKYNGEFIKTHFPELKPGPIYKKIIDVWYETYEDNLSNISKVELIEFTKTFIKSVNND